MANNHDVLRVRHQYNVNQNQRNRNRAAKSFDYLWRKNITYKIVTEPCRKTMLIYIQILKKNWN